MSTPVFHMLQPGIGILMPDHEKTFVLSSGAATTESPLILCLVMSHLGWVDSPNMQTGVAQQVCRCIHDSLLNQAEELERDSGFKKAVQTAQIAGSACASSLDSMCSAAIAHAANGRVRFATVGDAQTWTISERGLEQLTRPTRASTISPGANAPFYAVIGCGAGREGFQYGSQTLAAGSELAVFFSGYSQHPRVPSPQKDQNSRKSLELLLNSLHAQHPQSPLIGMIG